MYEPDLAGLRRFVSASFYEMNNTHLRAQYLATLGDAFSGLEEWQLAASMFDEVRSIESLRPGDPLHFHALIQQRICWLKMGDPSLARNVIRSIDPTKFQQLASLVLTIGVEYAKYLALCDQLNSAQEHKREIRTILQKTSLLARTDPKNREEYLRTLYYRMFERDLQILVQRKPTLQSTYALRLARGGGVASVAARRERNCMNTDRGESSIAKRLLPKKQNSQFEFHSASTTCKLQAALVNAAW